MTGSDDLVEGYRRQLRRRGLSERTISGYCDWALADLQRYTAGRELDRRLLEEWQDTLVVRGWKPKSRALAHTAVRGFVRWMAREDLVDIRLVEFVEPVRTPHGLPRPLDDQALERVRAGMLAYELGRSVEALRDRALFVYLLTTGARVSEALSLPRRGWERAVVVQKGGREKEMKAIPAVAVAIREYLAVRQDAAPWLWISQHGGHLRPLTRHAVRRRWQYVARRFGVEQFGSHMLRHSNATALYRAGAPEIEIARHLGHADLSTVHQYVGVANVYEEEMDRILERLVNGEQLAWEWGKGTKKVA